MITVPQFIGIVVAVFLLFALGVLAVAKRSEAKAADKTSSVGDSTGGDAHSAASTEYNYSEFGLDHSNELLQKTCERRNDMKTFAPRAPETAVCPECGQTVGIYNSGSLNRMRPAPQRFCSHVKPSSTEKWGMERCEGSYSRVEKENPSVCG